MTFPPGQLVAVAAALGQAYPTAGRARELFGSIEERFDAITDDADDIHTRMQDAVGALAARGCLLSLINAALRDHEQTANVPLHQTLEPIAQETRWQLLDASGLVLRLGPFVNRSNLKAAIDKIFLGRRVLQIGGTVKGRSWSCQLIERQAVTRGRRYVKVDLREAPAVGRESPVWLAETLHEKLFIERAEPPSIVGFAENRLVEPLLAAWVPPATGILTVIDHLGDSNVAAVVRGYAAALAQAVAENKLAGLKLILIDAPADIDLSSYHLQTVQDVAVQVTLVHLEDFFLSAARALFPGAPAAELQKLAQTAAEPLKVSLPAAPSVELATAVRDALENMAVT